MISQKKIVNKYWVAALFSAATFLFSGCQNKVEEVKKVTQVYSGPMEIQRDIDYTYSDSAKVQLRLQAPMAENYSQLEEPILEFREGLHVTFYDKQGEPESYIRSNYAIRREADALWEARGDVEAMNYQNGKKVNTELLFWNENEGLIYSDEFVKVTTPDNVIMGEGFEADQNFNWYNIFKVTGTISLNEENDSSATDN